MNQKQYTFSEFTRKMVINVSDGRELGHVCDMIFNNCGGVMALVVPGKKSLFKSLTSSENIFIPWNRIVKIGSDVILTDIVGNMASAMSQGGRQTAEKQYQSDSYAHSEPYVSDRDAQGQTMPPDPDSPSAQTFYHTS